MHFLCSTYQKYIFFWCSTFSFVALETKRFWATFPRVPGHLGLCHSLWAVYFLHFHRVMEMNMRAVHAKMLQLCPPLCDPINCSPPGFSVHRILQARILEWVAMPSSGVSSQPWDNTCVPNISFIGRQVLYHNGNEQVHSNEQVPYWLPIFHCPRKWQLTPVFLPGKSHGRQSLVGYLPRGRKESDTTERLHFHFKLTLAFSELRQ